MGTLTLAQIKTEVRRAFGGRTDLDDDLTTLINLAQLDVARTHHWDELGRTLSITYPYTGSAFADKTLDLTSITGGVWRVWTLRLTYESGSSTPLSNARKLVYKTPKQFDKYIPAPEYSTPGKPRIYTRFGGENSKQIEMWPSPDMAYVGTIRYGIRPTDFSADTDNSILEGKDDLIIARARADIATALDMQDKADKLEATYRRKLRNAMGADDDQPDEDILPEFETVLVVPGDYWLHPFIRSEP